MYEELMNAKILVDANALIAGFVHSGLLDKAKCGEVLELIKRCSEIQREWIPVDEKLPMADGEYLLFGKVCEDEEDNIFVGNYDACAESFGWLEGYYDKGTLGFLDSELRRYAEVKAWMPLPEPYKEESEENG